MPYRPSRRQVIAGMASAGLLTGSRSALAQAPKRVQIPDGEFSPLPIAIPNFVAGTPADAEVGVGVSQVIGQDDDGIRPPCNLASKCRIMRHNCTGGHERDP